MASPIGSPRSIAHWGLRHGIAGAAIRAGARRGDLQSRLFDPAVRANPYPLYDEIRERGEFVRGGLALLTAGHAGVTEVLRSDAFGVSPPSGRMPESVRRAWDWAWTGAPIGPVDPPSMLVTDPPEHSRYRRLVTKVFTARAVEAMRPMIEARCEELLDDMAATGDRVDLVQRYAGLLPVTVISQVLGIPLEMREQFLRWGAAGAPTLDIGLRYRTFRRSEVAIREGNAWMSGHFARLRKNPGDDLVSRLVHLESDGERLSERELIATAGLLLAAGFETTVNLLGSGADLMLRHPDQLAAARADPALWRNAVEELLRYESPVQNTARSALRDVELSGIRMRRGRFVICMLAAANRDPRVFADPHTFDIRRPNAREHLSFSSGAHYCIGAALARLEGEIGLRVLFERFPDLQLAGPGHRRPTRVLRGYDRLPVTLNPGRRAARSAAA